MKAVTLLAVIGTLTSPAFAGEGQALHDSSCIQCHSSLTGGKPNSLYTRVDRKVTTFEALQKRVKGCAVAADVTWSEQQRAQVVEYLTKSFYHF